MMTAAPARNIGPFEQRTMANTKLRRGYQSPCVIHVAVLECQLFPQTITKTHSHFTNIFETWLQRGAQSLNAKRATTRQVLIETSRWPVYEGVYPDDLAGIDAFVITGSLLSCYDDCPWIRTLELFLKGTFTSHIRDFESMTSDTDGISA
jgi:hypothetical protein